MYYSHFIKGNDSKKLIYKRYSNLVVKLKQISKKSYFQSKFNLLKNDLKGAWKMVNEILITKKNNSHTFSDITDNNNKLNDNNLIANCFGRFFSSIGKNLADNISPTTLCPESYLNNRVENNFKPDKTNEIEVFDILSNLKNTKTVGPDLISTQILKLCRTFIAEPLSQIFNKSILTGEFPQLLKTSKVIPIFKTGDKSLVNNYRPITITPVLSKVFEKLMFKRLIIHLNKNNILYKHQFGFRKEHSTELALFELTDSICKALDNGEYCVGIFLDLSKAFDSVDNNILLKKLAHYGIRDVYLSWFKSFLINRKIIIEINEM